MKEGKAKLMGFGHRVYKNYDPRAKIIKRMADEVFEVTRPSELLPIALELERIALQDDYFVSRKLYPNVDFYSGLIYQAIGFPVEMFPVLFAIPRTSGWLAQWQEMMGDPEQKIARPRQLYLGPGRRGYLEIGKRDEPQLGERGMSSQPPLRPGSPPGLLGADAGVRPGLPPLPRRGRARARSGRAHRAGRPCAHRPAGALRRAAAASGPDGQVTHSSGRISSS